MAEIAILPAPLSADSVEAAAPAVEADPEGPGKVVAGFVASTEMPETRAVAEGAYEADVKEHCDMILSTSAKCQLCT
ncbi:hypothetical protein HZ326_27185 [Fusarium oxysporum f. sp. albedinis]|nr:hypothetical protein HZ326_27185 [Fusarium oxysporum f. sp. albedinis]